MSDLIRRADAIHILACEMYAEAQAEGYDTKLEDYIQEAKAWMNDAPSADATEVVRCRECKYWREWENRVGSCHRSENRYNWFGVDSTDYCSFGERREPYKGGESDE